MTVIAALRTATGIEVGWDSCVSSDDTAMAAADPKVWEAWGGLVGVSGDAALCDVVRYAKIPRPTRDLREWACTKVAPILRAEIAATNIKLKYMGDILVVVKDEILLLDSHLGVTTPTLPYTAIGSGAQGTLCALEALLKSRKPSKRVLYDAIEATCKHVVGVGPPIFVKTVPLEELEE